MKIGFIGSNEGITSGQFWSQSESGEDVMCSEYDALVRQYLAHREQTYIDIVDVTKLSDEELEALARGEIPSGL